MRMVFELLSRLPLEWLYQMGAIAGFIVFRVARWRHAIASANIARAFPELGESARASILQGSYRNLGEIIAEFVWSYRATPAQIAERVSIDNPEVITGETQSVRSVLLMTAHYCNWEWQVLASNGVLDHPMYPVYKPQRLASLDRFILAARTRFGGTPIPHKALTRELIRHRREARVYAMVADQVPTIDEPKHWTRFLGQDSAFFVGADAVARILAAPVIFVGMHRVRRGYYRMHLERIAEPPYARGRDFDVIERYARSLETEIRAGPADWLWVHNRWKYARPQTD
jgi:Kdo2-lipid IVA lauroyltransferase/acyltransferase